MAEPTSSLLPSQETIDQAIQVRTRKRFLEEEKEKALSKLLPNQVSDDFKYIKEMEVVWNDQDKMQYNIHMERAVEDKLDTSGGIGGDLSDAYFERGSITSDKFGTLSAEKIKAAVSYAAQTTTKVTTSQTINNGNWGGLLIAFSDKGDPNRVIFGIFEVSAYKNSVAAANHIPRGSSTIGSQHKQIAYNDLHYNETALGRPGKDLGYVHLVQNNSGGSDTYYFEYLFRYLGNIVS